ncbi:MAG TPA: hypothetical protein VMS95_01810 [Candidatus Krumholzibacteriaceae bacterium]|nr:hypothetical protein [Candidatus Krumholzibacteriaceae bacterium]
MLMKPDFEINEYTVPISDFLTLRIYSDTRPHNWKTADLQKGLILVYKGAETIGEGTGFGVPVVKYDDETYFSGTSRVYVSQQKWPIVVRKEFSMDKIARNKFKGIRLENKKLRGVLRRNAELYQGHRHLRSLLLKDIYMKAGIQSSFVNTASVSKAIVTYCISRDCVKVKADFTLLKRKNIQKLFMFNEQGTRFFRKYTDSTGICAVDREIGAWDVVEAEWASITNLQGDIGFRLKNAKNSVLRRGQEFLEDCLDWVGFDYEINPKCSIYEYNIEILKA